MQDLAIHANNVVMTPPKSFKKLRLGYEPDPLSSRANMEAVVELLNPSRHPWLASVYVKGEPELRRLVDLWRKSGPNLYKLFEENSEFRTRAMNGQVILGLTGTGRAHLEWLPGSPNSRLMQPKEVALRHFMRLITNPEWELLGFCKRCENYYLKRRKSQKTYCSQTCGSRATATEAVKASRQKEHKKKLERAQEFIHKWNELRPRMPWKPWVGNETKYTPNWLTRAVNKGELRPPMLDRGKSVSRN